MRKGTIMVALVALLVAIFATAAYAATITCTGGTCNGTSRSDTLKESSGDDQMYGFRGADLIDARTYGGDEDIGYGGGGDDKVKVNDGDFEDTANGGGGSDLCVVDNVSEVGDGCDTVRVNPPTL